jgi:hypothetical protein
MDQCCQRYKNDAFGPGANANIFTQVLIKGQNRHNWLNCRLECFWLKLEEVQDSHLRLSRRLRRILTEAEGGQKYHLGLGCRFRCTPAEAKESARMP